MLVAALRRLNVRDMVRWTLSFFEDPSGCVAILFSAEKLVEGFPAL